MKRNKIIAADEAARVVLNNDTVAISGFGGTGVPEELAIALETRFLETGAPRDLTLIYAAGMGDGKTRGINHFAHEGMVKRVIGGYWGQAPSLAALALENKIEAYCFPQGVVSHFFRDIAAGKPGTITSVGLDTFIDPRLEGGRLNEVTKEDLIELIHVHGAEYLFFPAFPINVAFLRGTTADEEGNITMEKEALTLDVVSIAQAVKNSGGIVMVQVERVTTERILSPKAVRIPGIFVDCVVIARPQNHMQTFAESYNPAYTGEIRVPKSTIKPMAFDVRKVIARRAAMFLKINAIVNLGVGMPEGVSSVDNEENILDMITLTIDTGGIGGIPVGGQSFGAVANAQAIIDQPYQFDFYDGGGLDQAFLGLAEADEEGNLNVSRFGSRFTGAGAFINISQNAKAVYFMGAFMAGGKITIKDGRLHIEEQGTGKKFVRKVQQVTFSSLKALQRQQTVYYITERCVFRLTTSGLELVEIAPGIDLERDILAHMEFVPQMASPVREMDPAIFRDSLMGLQQRSPLSLEERVHYSTADNVVYINLEGLNIETVEDAQKLADFLDRKLTSLGKKVNAITNYDNFNLNPVAAQRFFDMVKHNHEQYFLSFTRYSTNAFFRHQFGEQFTQASLENNIYKDFEEAKEHL
jgi:propionate CoA-transferase